MQTGGSGTKQLNLNPQKCQGHEMMVRSRNYYRMKKIILKAINNSELDPFVNYKL